MKSLATDYGRRLYRFMDQNGINTLTFDAVYKIFSSMGEDLSPLNELERRMKKAFGNNNFIFKVNLSYLMQKCGANLNDFSDLLPIPEKFIAYTKKASSNNGYGPLKRNATIDNKNGEVEKEFTEDDYQASKNQSTHHSFAQRYRIATSKKTKPDQEALQNNVFEEGLAAAAKRKDEVNSGQKDKAMATILYEYIRNKNLDCLSNKATLAILKKHFAKNVDVSAFCFRAFGMTAAGCIEEKQLVDFLSKNPEKQTQIVEEEKKQEKITTEEMVQAIIQLMSSKQIDSLPFFSIEEFCLEKYGAKEYAKQLIQDVFFGRKRDIVFLENLSEYLNQIKHDKRNEPTYKYGEWPWIKTDERGPIDPREIVGGLTQVLIHFSGKPYAQMSDCMSFIVDHYPLSNSFRKYFYDIAGDSPMGKVSLYKLKLAKYFYEKDYFDVI